MMSMGLMMQPFSADKITLANPLNLECDRMYHKKMTVRETDKFYGNSASRNAILYIYRLQTLHCRLPVPFVPLFLSLEYYLFTLHNMAHMQTWNGWVSPHYIQTSLKNHDLCLQNQKIDFFQNVSLIYIIDEYIQQYKLSFRNMLCHIHPKNKQCLWHIFCFGEQI